MAEPICVFSFPLFYHLLVLSLFLLPPFSWLSFYVAPKMKSFFKPSFSIFDSPTFPILVFLSHNSPYLRHFCIFNWCLCYVYIPVLYQSKYQDEWRKIYESCHDQKKKKDFRCVMRPIRRPKHCFLGLIFLFLYPRNYPVQKHTRIQRCTHSLTHLF